MTNKYLEKIASSNWKDKAIGAGSIAAGATSTVLSTNSDLVKRKLASPALKRLDKKVLDTLNNYGNVRGSNYRLNRAEILRNVPKSSIARTRVGMAAAGAGLMGYGAHKLYKGFKHD